MNCKYYITFIFAHSFDDGIVIKFIYYALLSLYTLQEKI